MASFTKKKLSSSVDGKPILVTAVDTSGTLIHTAVDSTIAGTFDEIQLYAYNGHTANVVLTIEFGGVVVPDQNIIITIPYKSGLIPVVPGFILQNAMEVRAFAALENVITINGFINAIAP